MLAFAKSSSKDQFVRNSIVALCCRVTDDGVQTRAHLETQLASALALRSPNEYRQCLLSYIRFLARLVYFCFSILDALIMLPIHILIYCFCFLRVN